ncbi:MAG: hypothetical protein ABIS36_23060 [Chryseolinea sp.]
MRNFVTIAGVLRRLALFVALFVVAIACDKKASDHTSPNQIDWTEIGPGGGGATFIPTFSYQSSDDFILRCDMTGSYHSTDGGKSYHQINFPNGANAYAYDPKDPKSIWIGATTLNHSKDGGKSWDRIFPESEDIISETFEDDHANYSIKVKDSSLYVTDVGRIHAVKVDPVLDNTLYFSMGPYFFYSADGGDSWSREKLDGRIEHLYTNAGSLKDAVIIFSDDTLYRFDKSTKKISNLPLPKAMSPAFSFTAGTIKDKEEVVFYALHHDPKEEIKEEFGHSEVWTSRDAGKTWNKLSSEVLTNKSVGIKPSYSMIACAEFDAGSAYLVTNRYEGRKNDKFIYWYGAFKTSDGGKDWKWVWKGGGGSGQYGVKDGIDVQNLTDAWSAKAFGGEYIRLMDVGVAATDGNVAIVTDWYRAMRTTDGGVSWNEIYSEPQSDGTFKSRGLDVTTAYSVHFDPFDSNHIAISYTDIGYHHSYNRGKSWVRSTEGVPVPWINTCYGLVYDPEVKDKVWSVWSGMHDFPRGKMTRNPLWKQHARGGVCLSNDGGKTWSPLTTGIGDDSPATSIILDPKSTKGNRTLYVSVYNKGVFKSTDDGKSWTLKNTGIGDNVSAFELTQTSKGDLYLTISATPMHKDGKKGREYFSGEVYKSTDGAETWTKLLVTDEPLFPSAIGVDPENSDRIYLACWAAIDVSDLVGSDVARNTGGNELIKMPGGVFLSEDGGKTWRSIFDDKQYVYDVTPDPHHPGRLYICTFNQAAYQSDDYGKTWKKLKGYDFHWGQRVVLDNNDPEQIYITTFGSSVWHGHPVTD